MGWGYRKKFTLFPGVHINLSKTGLSTTVGVPGASLNIGKKGVYRNLGIPGSGFYSRERINGNNEISQGITDPALINAYDYVALSEAKLKAFEELYAKGHLNDQELTDNVLDMMNDPEYIKAKEVIENRAIEPVEINTHQEASDPPELWYKKYFLVYSILAVLIFYAVKYYLNN